MLFEKLAGGLGVTVYSRPFSTGDERWDGVYKRVLRSLLWRLNDVMEVGDIRSIEELVAESEKADTGCFNMVSVTLRGIEALINYRSVALVDDPSDFFPMYSNALDVAVLDDPTAGIVCGCDDIIRIDDIKRRIESFDLCEL